MSKIVFAIVSGACILFVLGMQPLYAGEMDILLKKLVEKKILTAEEAEEVLAETKEEMREGMKKDAGAAGGDDSLPGWVKNTKLKGDLRLRYERVKKEGSEDRHRGRIRYRLGVESKLADNLKVAAGLASGSSDPRSTNQSFQDAFSTKSIQLDYAYAEFKADEKLILYGGKMHRSPVIWEPSELLWDGDINPEGAALAFNNPIDSIDLFFNSGVFALDEASSDTSDPFMYYFQPGLNWALTDDANLNLALTYYGFDNVKGAALDNSSGTNTLDGQGNLLYDYSSLSPSAQLSLKNPFNGLFNYASLFGEYINNPDPGSDNDGFLLGLAFGDEKVKAKGQWQAKYMYARLEKDAWLDTFADSDRYSGNTASQSHEAIFAYGVGKNSSLGLDYYYSKSLSKDSSGSDVPEHILQFDWNLSW